MPRPKMPTGEARSIHLIARVRPSAAEQFKAKCAERGLTQSDALRQALGQWMKDRP